MIKVLVDRELLERAMYAKDGKELIAANRELRAILAQPAEAEGVEARLRRVIEELKAGFVVCQQCGDQEDTATLDCVPELEAIAATISAVTAERDRLLEEAELHDRIMSESCAKALAERDQLRAEVERLRNELAGKPLVC